MDTIEKLEVAEDLINAEDYQKAIEILTEMLNESHDEYDALILRGSAYTLISETDKAIADFNKAIEVGDEAELAYWYLSQIYSSKHDFLKAREYIVKAIEFNNENFQYLGDYIIIEQNLKNYSKSIELCSNILSEYPAEAFALYNRGYNYLCLKKYHEAINDFKRLLIEQPQHYIALNNLGFALSMTGEHEMAYKYLKMAIHLEPDFAYPYDNLGFVYYLDNNFPKALELINHSIELDHSNSWAYKNRALVYLALNEKEKASTDLLKAKELGYTEKYDNEVEELLLKV